MSIVLDPASSEKEAIWTPTNVQFLYRHRNRRYYVIWLLTGLFR
ncbi:hypothetical protein BH09VER1_BH09VER1_46960 [soil metagenome]